MATRKRKSNLLGISDKDMFALGGCCLVALFVINNLDLVLLFAGGLVVAGFVTYSWYRHHRRQELQRLRDALDNAIQQHEDALVSYFNQYRTKDQFGVVDDRRWQKQLDSFLRSQVVPQEPDFRSWRQSSLGTQAAELVDREVAMLAEHSSANLVFAPESDLQSGDDYERYCKALLENDGWNVTQTPATRDNGADLIATKASLRVAVQCKKYGQPVGNKAVQEVHSAKTIYRANVACVVAPNGYTRQAQSAALSHNVLLLHHVDLQKLAARLSSH